MVFDESYYKNKGVSALRKDRVEHHTTEARKIMLKPDYRKNLELQDLANEHNIEHLMLVRHFK